jgi:hypothetical protein
MPDSLAGPRLRQVALPNRAHCSGFGRRVIHLWAPNTRSPVSRQCPKTGANRLDKMRQIGPTPHPDMDVLDAIEQKFTLSGSLGVKWSQVQILSARRRSGPLTLLIWHPPG